MLTLKVVPHDKGECNCEGWLGGDASDPTWEDYIARFEVEWRPRLEALKEWVLAQSPYPCADEVCNQYHFEFSDGARLSTSWRAWGDFVQAAVNKREGYMAYYMRLSGKEWTLK